MADETPKKKKRATLRSPGVDDGRDEREPTPPPAPLGEAEPPAPALKPLEQESKLLAHLKPHIEAVDKLEAELRTPLPATVIYGQAARDPNKKPPAAAMRCSAKVFAAHVRMHPVHQAGFTAWALQAGHSGKKTVPEWEELRAAYLARPVK